VSRQQNVSEETARLIDAEVKRIVMESYERARTLIADNIDGLHTIAQNLLEFETLTGDEIRTLLEGGTIERPEIADAPPPPPSGGVGAIPKTGKRPGGLNPAPQA